MKIQYTLNDNEFEIYLNNDDRIAINDCSGIVLYLETDEEEIVAERNFLEKDTVGNIEEYYNYFITHYNRFKMYTMNRTIIPAKATNVKFFKGE